MYFDLWVKFSIVIERAKYYQHTTTSTQWKKYFFEKYFFKKYFKNIFEKYFRKGLGREVPPGWGNNFNFCICFCAFICLCLSFCSPSLGREVPPGWGNCKFSSYVSVSVLFSVNICPSVLSAWAGKYRQVGRTVGNNITYCSPLSGGAISWCQCGHRKSFQEVSLCRSQARINTEGH